jgi:hypothetical protein
MQVSLVTYVEGMKLDVTADRITIVYDGDIEIEVDPGRNLPGIRTIGDLLVRLPAATGDMLAGGILAVEGELTEAGVLHGKEVILERPSVKCKVISADDRIVIGPGEVVCNAMVAPRIKLDANATGRVTVIESHNERGPSKIKGGLSLAEYEETFGKSDEFVAEHGLERLGPPTPESTEPDEEEELYLKLSDALEKITACYDPDELPLPIEQLTALIETRDYDALRVNIDGVWNGLLKYHQTKKIRANHQVTHAFSLIHMLVQS